MQSQSHIHRLAIKTKQNSQKYSNHQNQELPINLTRYQLAETKKKKSPTQRSSFAYNLNVSLTPHTEGGGVERKLHSVSNQKSFLFGAKFQFPAKSFQFYIPWKSRDSISLILPSDSSLILKYSANIHIWIEGQSKHLKCTQIVTKFTSIWPT